MGRGAHARPYAAIVAPRSPHAQGVSSPSMAPKAKAKGRAPRAPKAAAKAFAGSSMENVLGDASTTAGSARKRRQLCRRDTEEKVRFCLTTHFAEVPQAELSTKVVDGKSLVETIKEDLTSGPSARLGKR